MATNDRFTTSQTRGAGSAGASGRAGANTSESAEPSETAKPARKPRLWLRVLIAVAVLLAVAIAVLGAVFAWDRWYRYDDAADIQGQWYPAGSTASIEIGPETISFDSDTSYSYTLDTHAKTLAYQLGPLAGQGHYWFADDRNALFIQDGEDFTAEGTALADLARMFEGVGSAIGGSGHALPEGEGISAFARTPDPEAVAAKEEAERQAREAEEEAARAEQEAIEAAERAEREAEEAAAKAAAEEAGELDGPEDPEDFANESMGILE